LAVGFAAAWGVTRLIGGLLFGLSPLDPVTYGGIGVALMVVTLLASYMPARRARGVDPMVALREQ
jgi:ABC-type antimicrobial peptide transport system permease subunit